MHCYCREQLRPPWSCRGLLSEGSLCYSPYVTIDIHTLYVSKLKRRLHFDWHELYEMVSSCSQRENLLTPNIISLPSKGFIGAPQLQGEAIATPFLTRDFGKDCRFLGIFLASTERPSFFTSGTSASVSLLSRMAPLATAACLLGLKGRASSRLAVLRIKDLRSRLLLSTTEQDGSASYALAGSLSRCTGPKCDTLFLDFRLFLPSVAV